MSALLAAVTAAQLLIHAPQQALGATQAEIERKLGASSGVGTDYLPSRIAEGSTDQVITVEFPQAQVRVYVVPSARESFLLSVSTARDLFPTGAAVGVGSDRGAVLRELGGPSYEDDDQIVYTDPHPDNPKVGDSVRLNLKNDRVVGIEWRYVVAVRGRSR